MMHHFSSKTFKCVPGTDIILIKRSIYTNDYYEYQLISQDDDKITMRPVDRRHYMTGKPDNEFEIEKKYLIKHGMTRGGHMLDHNYLKVCGDEMLQNFNLKSSYFQGLTFQKGDRLI